MPRKSRESSDDSSLSDVRHPPESPLHLEGEIRFTTPPHTPLRAPGEDEEEKGPPFDLMKAAIVSMQICVSLIVLFTGIIGWFAGFGDESDKCTFVGLITTVVGLWIPSPVTWFNNPSNSQQKEEV